MLPVFAIRAGGAGLTPAVLRAAIREADPRISDPELLSMRDIVSASLLRQRFNMTLMSLFAAMALVLTSVGVYGVVSYAVARRAREIGVRMALGAPRASVLRLVVRQGMTPVLVGLGVGVAASLALTRVLSGMLYGVSPRDPVSLVSVAFVLAGVGLLASWVPARRAARVDPLVALREE
jgi:ABC-type antimicrobial peptide transport system permease subunit